MKKKLTAIVIILLVQLAIAPVLGQNHLRDDNPDYKNSETVDKPSATFSMARLPELDGVLKPTSKHQILHHFTSFTMPNDLWLVERLKRNDHYYQNHPDYARREGYFVRFDGQALYDERNYEQIAAKYPDAPKTRHLVRWTKKEPITIAVAVDLNRGINEIKTRRVGGVSEETLEEYPVAIEKIRNDAYDVFKRLEPSLERATGLELEFISEPDPDVYYKKYDGDPFKLADITIHFVKESGWTRNRRRKREQTADDIAFETYEIAFPVLHHQHADYKEFYKNSNATKEIIGVSVIDKDYAIQNSICNVGISYLPEGKEYHDKYIENCLIMALGLRMDSDFYDFDYLMFLLNSLYSMEPGWTYQQYVSSNIMQRISAHLKEHKK